MGVGVGVGMGVGVGVGRVNMVGCSFLFLLFVCDINKNLLWEVGVGVGVGNFLHHLSSFYM